MIADPPTATPAQPGERAPAPGDLKIVQDFINSLDREAGVEAFESSESLAAWTRDHGLVSTPLRVSQSDLQRVRTFRELLRSLARANNGYALSSDELSALNRELARLTLAGQVDVGGRPHLEPATLGLDAALALIAAIVMTEMLGGRWARLKACQRDICEWVFYDRSRSQTGTWCTMAICGSRVKASAYYHRRNDRRSA